MSLVGSNNEQKIWNFLKGKGLSDHGIAGLMGNLFAESGLIPNNLQNSYEKSTGYTDAGYTAAVDDGTYTKFADKDEQYGYGLAQWTYYTRKAALLAYARKTGRSIGDLEMQLEFLVQELTSYGLMNSLKAATSVREASDLILLKFERPASMNSEETQSKRAGYGQTYYDKYAEKTGSTTTAATPTATKSSAAAVLKVAEGEIGYIEKATCSQLDDKTANAGSKDFTKYASDFDQKYPNWYNGKKNGFAWCDMFVDWCFVTAFGYEEALRLLCQPEKSCGAGCTYSLGYYKQKGRLYTSGPKPGDQIFFGKSQSNVAHTGLVEKVDGSKVYTIEGNTSNRVARRSYALTDTSIVGYGRPDYGTVDNTPTPTVPTTTTTTQQGTASGLAHKVGDIVDFTGTKHYTNANASTGPTCKPGKAKVTQVFKTGKHPYHLIAVSGGGSTVYGWVDASDIDSGGTVYTVVKGDSLWAIAQEYLGKGNRYPEIMALNGMKTTTIHPGQKLRLPS